MSPRERADSRPTLYMTGNHASANCRQISLREAILPVLVACVPSWQNVSHLEKWVTLWEMGQTWKNGSHVQKWVTFRKNGSHLQKWVKLGKLCHMWKYMSHLENLSQLEIWVTLGKMGHTWKNGSCLEKGVTLEKIGHTWKNGSHTNPDGSSP